MECDESWIMRVNESTESWIITDQELPQRVRQKIRVTQSNLAVFFNPTEFVKVNLLPQGTSLAAVHLVDNVTVSFASRHAQQQGDVAVSNHICISTIPNATLLGMSKNRWTVIGTSVIPTTGIHPIWLWQTSTGCPAPSVVSFSLRGIMLNNFMHCIR
jgi:hypothetical protein